MPDHSVNIPKLWQLLFHLEIDRVSRQWLEKYASSCPFLDQRTSTTVHHLFVACDTVLIITIHSSSVGRSTFDVFVARIERSSSQSRPLQSQDTCRPCNFISKAWTHSRHLLRDVDQYTFPLSACRVDSLDQIQLNSLAKTASLLGHHHFHLIEDSKRSTSSSLEHVGHRMTLLLACRASQRLGVLRENEAFISTPRAAKCRFRYLV